MQEKIKEIVNEPQWHKVAEVLNKIGARLSKEEFTSQTVQHISERKIETFLDGITSIDDVNNAIRDVTEKEISVTPETTLNELALMIKSAQEEDNEEL